MHTCARYNPDTSALQFCLCLIAQGCYAKQAEQAGMCFCSAPVSGLLAQVCACKPPRVQLQRHMPAFSLLCTAPLRIRASAKLQCTGARVTCTGVQDTNLTPGALQHMPCVLHSNPEHGAAVQCQDHSGCGMLPGAKRTCLLSACFAPLSRACASADAPGALHMRFAFHTPVHSNPDTSALQFC